MALLAVLDLKLALLLLLGQLQRHLLLIVTRVLGLDCLSAIAEDVDLLSNKK